MICICDSPEQQRWQRWMRSRVGEEAKKETLSRYFSWDSICISGEIKSISMKVLKMNIEFLRYDDECNSQNLTQAAEDYRKGIQKWNKQTHDLQDQRRQGETLATKLGAWKGDSPGLRCSMLCCQT